MSEEIQKEYKETFDLFDVDNNGFLDIQTTKQIMIKYFMILLKNLYIQK